MLAARAAGASQARIAFVHVLRNSLAPVFVQASLDVGGVIMVAAALGFIGIGAQPPAPEWGLMVSMGRRYSLMRPWMVVFPGMAIYFAVMSANLLGDGLREMLDPKMRKAIL